MFELEVKKIIEKYENSKKFVEEAELLNNKYSNIDNYCYLRMDGRYEIESRAKQSIDAILQHLSIHTTIKKYTYKNSCSATLEELANRVLNININDLYYNITYYLAYNSNRFEYSFNNLEYKETDIYYNKLLLILNCIWLYNHNELLTPEVEHKIYCKSNNGETFIFNGCKVTLYKNKNLKINFTDEKMFEDFKTRFNEAFKLAKSKIEEEENRN